MSDGTKALNLAYEAAKIAAEPLKQSVAGYRTIQVEEAHDVKLKADQESERRIREFLSAKSPYPIIGEEEGGDSGLWHSDDPYWVVDPLDGTYNYLRSSPQCCVSIALMHGQKPGVGVVYDFNTDTVYTGGIGLPFAINGLPHHPVWAESLARACLTTGFPHEMKRDPASMQIFFDKLLQYRKVRMIGTAALAVAHVAAGYCDVYYETGIKLWDIAAGLAFAESVGAVVQMREWDDKPLHFDIWLAGSAAFITQ